MITVTLVRIQENTFVDYIIARHGRVLIAKSGTPDYAELLRAFKARASLCIQGVPYGITAKWRKAGRGKRGEGWKAIPLAAAYADNRYKAFRRMTKESTGQPRGSLASICQRVHTRSAWYYYTGWQRVTRKNPISTVFVPLVKTKGNLASRFFYYLVADSERYVM